MRQVFLKQLEELHEELIKMGSLCEDAIHCSVNAMQNGDSAQALAALPLEAETDQMERVIENRCMSILLHQQPVAGDLRRITAAIKMITDLERIGDQALDIAEIVAELDGRSVKSCLPLPDMAREVIDMVSKSIDSYVKQDLILAQGVISQDSRVDEYFERVKDYLIELISHSPYEGAYALDLLMIAKYLERIGDHATNIAEWVIFSETGLRKGQP